MVICVTLGDVHEYLRNHSTAEGVQVDSRMSNALDGSFHSNVDREKEKKKNKPTDVFNVRIRRRNYDHCNSVLTVFLLFALFTQIGERCCFGFSAFRFFFFHKIAR